jgi:transcriptional regulator of acetoin/glycerol metabolism
VLTLPPLRARRADLGLLIRARLDALGSDAVFRPNAARALLLHDWPGNIRDLVQVIELADLQREGPIIERAHLPAALGARQMPPPTSPDLSPEDAAERAELIAQLAEFGGNVTALCRRLDVHRVTLYRRFRRLGIDPAAHRGG